MTHPTLGVELSLYCNFFSHREKSLVIAGANVIRVFRLVAEVPTRTGRRDDRHEAQGWMFLFTLVRYCVVLLHMWFKRY